VVTATFSNIIAFGLNWIEFVVFKNADLFLYVKLVLGGPLLTLFQIRHAISRTNGGASWSPGCFHATDSRTSGAALWGLQGSRQGMSCSLSCHRSFQHKFRPDASNGISHVFMRDVHNRVSMSIHCHSVWVAGLMDMASILQKEHQRNLGRWSNIW